MGRKRRLRNNNPKFSKKHSTHPKMIIQVELPKLIHIAEAEPPKEEPKEEIEVKEAIQLKPDIKKIAEVEPVVEKPKTTKKRRTTSTKAKAPTRRPRAKKTATKRE